MQYECNYAPKRLIGGRLVETIEEMEIRITIEPCDVDWSRYDIASIEVHGKALDQEKASYHKLLPNQFMCDKSLFEEIAHWAHRTLADELCEIYQSYLNDLPRFQRPQSWAQEHGTYR